MSSPVWESTTVLRQTLREGKSLSNAKFTLPFAQQLTYGTLRYYLRLDYILNQLLNKSLSKRDDDIYFLLITALYQLIYSHQPDYAVVNETVNQAQHKSWAKKLINGVLRNFLRDKTNYLIKADHNVVSQFAHPQWLITAIQQAYPAQWQQILTANNNQAPFTLRINRLQATRDQYLPGSLHPYNDCGITLAQAQKTSELAGFAEGKVSVQDGAPQLAAGLLDLQPHQRVLDACAAPGNKTAHLLETEPTIALTAIDQSPERLALVSAQLQRLQLPSIISVAKDITNHIEYETYDRILLDAPCSATGVIRRHPDIKHHRRLSDIDVLIKKQSLLLEKLWRLLSRGGKLLYATCSILPAENAGVISRFLKNHHDAKEVVMTANWGIEMRHGRQILPGEQDMDGFYYALLCKA